MNDPLDIGVRGDGVRLTVQVKPRSSKSAILGVKGGALLVALRSPPVEGAANAELIELLARALSVRKGDVTIGAGAGSKKKLVDVRAIDVVTARARLASP